MVNKERSFIVQQKKPVMKLILFSFLEKAKSLFLNKWQINIRISIFSDIFLQRLALLKHYLNN